MYILNIYITKHSNFLVMHESPRWLGLQRLGLALCTWDIGGEWLFLYWEWLIFCTEPNELHEYS